LKILINTLAQPQLGITIASLALGWVGENVATNIIVKLFGAAGYKPDISIVATIAVPASFCPHHRYAHHIRRTGSKILCNH